MGRELALANDKRTKTDAKLGNASIVASPNDSGYILVCLRSLFGNLTRTGDLQDHALLGESLQDGFCRKLLHCSGAAESAAGSMASGAECGVHSVLSASEDIAASAHAPTDDDRLTNRLVAVGKSRMARRECTGGALAVDEDATRFTVDNVLLELGKVVANVVNEVHVELTRVNAKDLTKRLTSAITKAATVGIRKVGAACHSPEVILTLLACDWHSVELRIILVGN